MQTEQVDNNSVHATDVIRFTFECAPNIAVVKYWGKRDDELILPLNSSLSVSLDSRVLSSRTTICLIKRARQATSSNEQTVHIWLNNAYQTLSTSPSAQHVAQKDLISRKRFLKMLSLVTSKCLLNEPAAYDIHIRSRNNFPTACGLASSASGFACLAVCLSNALGYAGDTSELARLGSGSACRSCLAGFVKWTASDESATSIASTLYPNTHWPELNVLVLVLVDERKDVSSTSGMRNSVRTSELLKTRVALVERERMESMSVAIGARDFAAFAELTMRESNSLHAVCLDTYPPLFYMSDKSREIVRMVDKWNTTTMRVAYSFDAGPNAFLFVLDKHLPELLRLIHETYFASSVPSYAAFLRDKLVACQEHVPLFGTDSPNEQQQLPGVESNCVKYVIHSKVGGEPVNLTSAEEHALLDKLGQPIN